MLKVTKPRDVKALQAALIAPNYHCGLTAQAAYLKETPHTPSVAFSLLKG